MSELYPPLPMNFYLGYGVRLSREQTETVRVNYERFQSLARAVSNLHHSETSIFCDYAYCPACGLDGVEEPVRYPCPTARLFEL